MTLSDSLCAHENLVLAYRARRLLAGEPEGSRALQRLRHKRKGHPLVTVDALYVLRQAGHIP